MASSSELVGPFHEFGTGNDKRFRADFFLFFVLVPLPFGLRGDVETAVVVVVAPFERFIFPCLGDNDNLLPPLVGESERVKGSSWRIVRSMFSPSSGDTSVIFCFNASIRFHHTKHNHPQNGVEAEVNARVMMRGCVRDR